MRKLKVAIADDHMLFRKALASLLKTFSCVGEVRDAQNGKELLRLLREEPADVVILDLQMPVMDGAEAAEIILERFPEAKIIILTQQDSHSFILHMMEMGVHAFLLKDTDPEELRQAIEAVVAKDFFHNDLVASILRKSVRDKKPIRPDLRRPELSDREKEIVRLICQELTIKEMSLRLGISDNTVRNHRVNIMEKIGVTNVVGLVKYAYQSGLIR